jgi:FkbM family methyltransferase
VLVRPGEFLRVLRFASTAQHPRRREIAVAYLNFRARRALAQLFRQPFTHFSLLGTRVHFADTTSFNFLFWELFIEESYGGGDTPPKTIVDCGSNIGMSIIFFKSLWPQAAITAIEASPAMVSLLSENIAGLTDVTLVAKAVGDQHGSVAFYAGDNSLVASTAALRGGGTAVTVETVPLSSLISGPVDLLKMDIEGSEIKALTELAASGKMRLVQRMLIEYHHHLPGHEHKLSSFLSLLECAGFDYEIEAVMPEDAGAVQDILIRARRVDRPAS